jgi:hypothetical protein
LVGSVSLVLHEKKDGRQDGAVAQSNVVVVSDGLAGTLPPVCEPRVRRFTGYRGFASYAIRATQQSIPLLLCFERRDLDRLVFVLPVLLGS